MTTDKVIPLRARKAADKPASAASFPVRVNLVLTLDDQPKATISADVLIEKPAEGQAGQISWLIDARQMASELEKLLGPAKPKIWTPKD